MPAPTNIDAASATNVGTLPATITQDVNFGGTTYDVWYKYTAASNDDVVSFFAYGNIADYLASISIWESDGVTNYLNIYQQINKPIQIPVTPGALYYLQIQSFYGSPVSPAILTLTGKQSPRLAIPIGSLLINDDTDKFFAIVLSATDGSALRFYNLVNGEAGDVLPSGIFALTNDDQGLPHKVFIYSAAMVLIGSALTIGSSAVRPSIRGNGNDKFYVADPVTGVISTVSSANVVGGTTWTLPTIARTIAPNRNDTILYWSRGNVNDPMKRWDLVNNIALSDLVAAPTGYAARFDTLVLANGDILITWVKLTPSAPTPLFRQYNPDGTLVRTFLSTLASDINSGDLRLAINAEDDSSAFWLWDKGGIVSPVSGYNLRSRFIKFKVSDGSILTTFDEFIFQAGLGPYLDTGWPSFGSSKSCPFLVMRVAIAGPSLPKNADSGLYKIVPSSGSGSGKTSDSLYDSGNVAIPEPFGTTYLSGESSENG